MNKYLSYLILFCNGSAIMILELLTVRITVPYTGNSYQTWTIIISLFLSGLSIGYFVGGKFADKYPNVRTLSAILIVTAISIACIPFEEILLSKAFTYYPDNPPIRAVGTGCFLFITPLILCGTISPLMSRLNIQKITSSGRIMGTLYAVSTLGSIVGTFLGGFLLIPFLGTIQTVFFLSFLYLCQFSLLLAKKNPIKSIFLFILLCTLIMFSSYASINMKGDMLDIDTLYNRIFIYDLFNNTTHRNMKILQLGKQDASAIYENSDDLVFEYTKYYRLADYFNPGIKKGLMLGGGGYSYPKDFIKNHLQAHLDVVEIDPSLPVLAKKYFRLKPSNQLTFYSSDARTFLNNCQTKYDVIFNDAYSSEYTAPFQMTTREAVEHMYRTLSSRGVVMANVISSVEGDTGKFLRAEYTTYSSVFPYVIILPVTDSNNSRKVQNIMIVALKNKNSSLVSVQSSELKNYLQHIWKYRITSDMPVLTDNYAPVETYIHFQESNFQ